MCGNYLISPFENVKRGGKYGDVSIRSLGLMMINRKIWEGVFRSFITGLRHVWGGRNVLLHCVAGISLSPTFFIAYLMKKKWNVFTVSHCSCDLTKRLRPAPSTIKKTITIVLKNT